jgi:hypothetical protein
MPTTPTQKVVATKASIAFPCQLSTSPRRKPGSEAALSRFWPGDTHATKEGPTAYIGAFLALAGHAATSSIPRRIIEDFLGPRERRRKDGT